MSDDSGDLAAAEEVALNALFLRAIALHDSIRMGEGATGWNDALCKAILTRLVLAAKVEALEPLLSLAWHVRESGLDAWYIPAEAVRYALTRLRAQECREKEQPIHAE